MFSNDDLFFDYLVATDQLDDFFGKDDTDDNISEEDEENNNLEDMFEEENDCAGEKETVDFDDEE